MKHFIKNILVPLNFSDSSESAIATAVAMCKRHKADLHLLSVRESNNFVLPPGKRSATLEMFLVGQSDLLKELESMAARIQEEHEINCFFHVGTGAFYKEIATKAEDFHCDLILVEKKQKQPLFSFTGKKSPYQLLKTIKRPVLSIPAGSRRLRFKNVLLSLLPSLSDTSSAGIALPIIRKNNSKVVLYTPMRGTRNQSELEISNELTDRLQTLMTEEHSLDIGKEINTGPDIAKSVISRAEHKETDLIIVPAAIVSGLKSWFKSSSAQKIIDNSPLPVLAVL